MFVQDGFFEDNAFKSGATAEGNIRLPVRKSAASHIYYHFIESFPLAFMDGNRPCQHYRVLPETADAFRAERAFINVEFEYFPGIGSYIMRFFSSVILPL
jgi:hypothetical protein